MPYLKLNTNVSVDDSQTTQLLARLSGLIAQETGKPERYIMVDFSADRPMLFGGSDAPLAYLECKSIGLNSAQVKSLATSLPQCLQEVLTIPADRIYIEFSDCRADFWGWNNSTFG